MTYEPGKPQHIHVRKLSDQSIVRSILCPDAITERDLERVMSGILANLSDDFYVDITMVETVDGSTVKAG